jgi:DNA-binding NarL/FixJ family response regulator
MKILIADDHGLVRRGLQSLIETRPEWTVCGMASTGREAVQLVQELAPDVAILDLMMPEMTGLDATRHIVKFSPRTQVLLLSLHYSDQLVRDAIAAGVRGYVLKSDSDRDLFLAIEKLAAHQPFFSSVVAESIWKNVPGARTKPLSNTKESLTLRQREVVQLLAEGKTSKEVASALNISIKTAETHRNNAMRKINAHGLADVVRYAVRNHLIEP